MNVIFILDKSGSMMNLCSDTIGGYNSMLDKYKKEEGEIYVTTVLFNHTYTLLYKTKPISDVQPMTKNEYLPTGNTALFDAIGNTLSDNEIFKNDDKNICVIITDGLENSSREYNINIVKKLIEEKRKLGCEFIFLGANIDAVNTAESIGIDKNMVSDYVNDEHGTELNFKAIGNYVCNSMKKDAPRVKWNAEIDEYYKSKNNKSADKRHINGKNPILVKNPDDGIIIIDDGHPEKHIKNTIIISDK